MIRKRIFWQLASLLQAGKFVSFAVLRGNEPYLVLLKVK